MLLHKYTSGEYHSYEEFRENFEIKVPDNFNFAYDVVDELAEQSPDKVAIVWCNDQGEERNFTFADLKFYSDKAANFFRSAGIGKGDPVMLVLKRRHEFWYSLLALHKIGAIAVPATHLLTAKDFVYRNNAADIKMIVCVASPEVIEHVEKAQGDSPSLQTKVLVGGSREGWLDFDAEMAKADSHFEKPTGEAMTRNDNISLLYFTSGTTAFPKMVRHNFTYPLGHIVTAKYWQNVEDGGLHLTVSETGWAKSVWGKIYGQWLAGSAVFVYDFEKFIPRDLLAMVAKHGVTTFCAPPTIYRYLIKEDLSQFDLSKLKYCVVAGEPLNPEIYNQFLKLTGIKLREGYGQTECTMAVGTFPWMEPRPGSMGKPSPGYEVDIVDEEGRSCEVGEVGEIIFRTDIYTPVGIFDGYYRDREMTESVWHDGVYHTRDTAWRDEDGYFWFVGRTDDVIKSSGYRIGPFEVESALIEHPAVLECAVTGVPDPLRGQIVKATVVLTKNYQPGEELVKELQEHVKRVTAPYKYPRVIEFVAELPKTISGKIRRVEIREKDRTEA
ncbi:acetyl-CoA synthetase [Hydrogenispora ethanolica]|jgi:acetyl-CoA synthetase|uniref:Acetyl-CoA synthetase n=1 Tax=Hydrogenispora ethanolica TaxID=1082276 RepID=A0A4R1RGV3_HYDET|nr:acetyl-CoA synthetase [Hydrogenispora ethanolica]